MYNFSLHSKRFRLVCGTKKDRGRGFLVLAAQEMKEEPKNEGGGGEGRKRLQTNPRFPAMSFHALYSSLVFFARC